MAEKNVGGVLILDCESGILDTVSQPIEHGPHTGRGEPWAVSKHDRPLTNRQQAILDRLPGFHSRVWVKKNDVSMMDLAALTAKAGVEFAMFTKESERLIVRGDAKHVNVSPRAAAKLSARGYKWSGHTHVKGVIPSPGDKAVLKAFNQPRSAIYDAMGNRFMVTSE